MSDDARRPGLTATARELWRAERRLRWGPDEVARHQLMQVRRAVAHAAGVPLYKERLTDAPPLHSVADLAALPMVERHHLVGCGIEDRRGTPATSRTLTKLTSGTTGSFLAVERSSRMAWWQGVLEVRRNRARGVQPWERTAAVRVAADHRARGGLFDALAGRSHVLPASDGPAAIAGALERINPVAISGFGHLLLDVGAELQRPLRPRVVGTGGQLLAEADREALAALFGVPPLDLYGTVEVGSIAWECPAADLYHLEHDSVLVELVDPEGHPVPAGEIGDVVVTALLDRHMPVIRYRVGDRARFATRPCSCGYRGPALAELQGRTMDRFIDSDGETVASSRLFISAQIDDAPRWVRRYRLVQGVDRSLVMHVVPAEPLPDAVVASIVAAYQAKLGSAVPVHVEMVDSIPLEPSGKLRQFVSHATCTPAD